MKWIGQLIYDQIARFRNDVYLQNISSGTIASGGNLGLDSNNKIVKATEAAGDITGVALTASTGIDLTSVANATGGDYAATIGVDVSDFMTNGSDNRVLTATGADAMNAEANLTFDGSTLTLAGDLTVNGDTVTFQSANADDPIVTIKNTSNDANEMASLNFIKDRDGGTAAIGDNLAEIYFSGEDASGNAQEYARILSEIDVATHGQESGRLKFGVANHDGGNGYGLTLTGGSVNNEVDVTVGLGAASVTTVAGDLTVNGTRLTLDHATRNDIKFTNTGDEDHYIRKDGDFLRFRGHDDSTVILELKNNTNGSNAASFPNGNLGIGVTDPDSLLEIFGTSTQLKLSNNVSDYATLTTGTHGDLTITTVDAAAAAAHIELAADGNITLDAAGSIVLEPGGGAITSDAASFTITNTSSGRPDLILQNITDDNSAATLTFDKNRFAGGVEEAGTLDGDILGTIEWTGTNNVVGGSELITYANIVAHIEEVDDTDESGRLTIQVAASNGSISSMQDGLILRGDKSTRDANVTIGNQPTSTATVAGNLMVTTGIELGHTSDTTIARSASGTATIEGKEIVTIAKQKQVTFHQFTDNMGTTKHYVGLNEADAENTSTSNKFLPFPAVTTGKLIKVALRSNKNLTGHQITFRLEKIGAANPNSATPDILGAQTGAGCNTTTMTTYDFTTGLDSGDGGETNAFSASDLVFLSIQSDTSFGSNVIYYMTCIWEFDLS